VVRKMQGIIENAKIETNEKYKVLKRLNGSMQGPS
jgi:hypothetical protein